MTLEPVRLVEAALFSAGKPISLEEIVQATKLATPQVQDALKTLHREYAERETALEVVKSGPKWAMAVRTAYSDSTKMLAAPEIPRRVLKTLALIAFHQPIKQADLKGMVGSVVYDHVHELYERGMISERQSGITKILTTTDRFLEYFGIDASNRDEVRTWLAQRVGLDLASLQKPVPEDGAPPPGAGEGSAEPARESASSDARESPGPAAEEAAATNAT